MSLADDKRNIFNKIGANVSLVEAGDIPQQTDSFTSINNKDDIIPFLLDVLKTVAGTEAIKLALGGLFGKLIDTSESKVKSALTKQFTKSNANDPLPTAPNNFMNDGITVPVKTIDVKGKFKVDPNTTTGNLIYGSGTNNFDKVARNAISNAGTFEDYENLSIKYIEASDSFQIKPKIGVSGNIGEFFTEYINNAELIDKKLVISNVMDTIYGTLANDQNKTIEQTYEELQTQLLLEQILNDDDDAFTISPDKYDDLLTKSTQMVNGVLSYDMGCGMMPAELVLNDFNTTVSTISGSTDPFYIGNEFEKSINMSTSGNTDTNDLTKENIETIKDGFFQKIIKVFTTALLEAVTTAPQIRVLMGMMSSLENNGEVILDKASNDLKNFKILIKCMAKEIMILVAEFIFAIAVTYLIKLIKPVVLRVLKEKINQFVGIIKSLTQIK